jgi:hypothetical protein
MLLTKSKHVWISSYFTRKRGYTDIQFQGIAKKNTVSILNSLTPQGASIGSSIRIAKVNQYLGVGYYWMVDQSNAFISTILRQKNSELIQFLPPLEEASIPLFAQSRGGITLAMAYDFDSLFNIHRFTKSDTSKLLYSYLTGDSMIILHPRHSVRLEFMGLLLALSPPSLFDYTRFTSNCSELDGNENIIGVPELARKYRSHKKLYLPLDTIFVDLENGRIEGDGAKSCQLTDELTDTIFDSYDETVSKIYKLFGNLKQSNGKAIDYASQNFTHRIKAKLGLATQLERDWMMF